MTWPTPSTAIGLWAARYADRMNVTRSGAVGGRHAVPGITTFREGSLHAALKARYAATIAGAQVESAVDGFVIDVVGPTELVEIQTGSFGSAGRKLEQLVVAHRVVLVYPISIERWLVRVDADGAVLRRRRSPKRGLALDLFDELVHIPGLVAHPNFRIELSLIREEEIRGPIPDGARYRYPRDWRRLDRRLLDVIETWRIDTPADLLGLLPLDLPDPFTTADIVASTGRSKRLAMRAVYSLERSGAIKRLPRRGRLVAYGQVPAASVGA
jgi:hypothetical protein